MLRLNKKGFTVLETVITFIILMVVMYMLAVFIPVMANSSRNEELRVAILAKNISTIELLKTEFYNGNLGNFPLNTSGPTQNYLNFNEFVRDTTSNDLILRSTINGTTILSRLKGIDRFIYTNPSGTVYTVSENLNKTYDRRREFTTVSVEYVKLGSTYGLIGTNVRDVYEGTSFGDDRYDRFYVTLLSESDTILPFVLNDSTGVGTTYNLVYRKGSINTTINGISTGTQVNLDMTPMGSYRGVPIYLTITLADTRVLSYTLMSDLMSIPTSNSFIYKVTVSTTMNEYKPINSDLTFFLAPLTN